MGSSSKPKSSKKKSSKIHSQPRKMKKAKKSRRSKSKKVTRRHDTPSSDDSQSISSASNDSRTLYSDSDLMNSVSFSSSSSDGTYRVRKKVSHVKSKLKSKRKKVRRKSSGSESSEDLSSKKKRKRSKKNSDSKSRKKSHKYKARRDVKSSSPTSDSHGSSPYKEENSSFSEKSTDKKLKMKSKKTKTHKRESREERVETKKRTHRSPSSSSSYSRSLDQSYSLGLGEETFISEGKSRRLRSVITFVEQAQSDGSKSEKDSLKEEIIYEHDDYLSPKSNDSSHGGSKKDVTFHSPVPSGSKTQKESVDGDDTCVYNHKATEVIESRKITDDKNGHEPFLNESQADKYEKESSAHGSLLDANSGADDLEAILRQKALENLKKFRGVVQRNAKRTANQKNKDAGDANQPFSSKAEIVHRVLLKQENTNVIDHVRSVVEVSSPNKHIPDGRYSALESESSKEKAIHPPDALVLSRKRLKESYTTKPTIPESELRNSSSGIKAGNSKEKAIHPSDALVLSRKALKENYTTKPAIPESESQNSSSGIKASGMSSNLNQATILQASSKNKLSETIENEKKIPPKTTESTPPSITNHNDAGVNNASSSAPIDLSSRDESTSQGQGSNEQQTEAKDGSQYEQKTMTMMRGGELVQVSYKVYIPKRAPALARRQLKR